MNLQSKPFSRFHPVQLPLPPLIPSSGSKSTLLFYPQGSQLNLALVQSITEVSCAIQAVGDCPSFGLFSKQEALRTLLVSTQSQGHSTGEIWGVP